MGPNFKKTSRFQVYHKLFHWNKLMKYSVHKGKIVYDTSSSKSFNFNIIWSKLFLHTSIHYFLDTLFTVPYFILILNGFVGFFSLSGMGYSDDKLLYIPNALEGTLTFLSPAVGRIWKIIFSQIHRL